MHAVDACPAYGRRGHRVKTLEVLVGSTCSRHHGADKLSTRSEEAEANDAQDSPSNRLKAVTVTDAIDSPLRRQLLEKFKNVFDTDEQFIPARDLDHVLTARAIEVELQSHGLEDHSSFIFQRARRLFAILLVIQRLDTLRSLIKEDLGDEILPLKESVFTSLESNKLSAAFSKWDLDARTKFLETQWTVLVPIFSDGEHLQLDDNARLPFIKTEQLGSGGGYVTVHRVQIHGGHEKFEKYGSYGSQKVGLRSSNSLLMANNDVEQGDVYALKQFTEESKGVGERAFNRELAFLRSIRSSGHGYIVGHLATFEQRGRYSIIFPLAEEDLRQFWANTTPSSIISDWCFQEMVNIANALSYLHNDIMTQDSRPMKGYHMDLKPENILMFKDSSSGRKHWKISDFGYSYLLPGESKQELPPHPGLGTYEPPECQLNLPQSRASDIWSLACVFLECVAWSIKGSGAIDAFAEDRLTDVEVSGNMFKDDYFFTLEYNESFTPVKATTRPAVIKWIRDLARDPKCDEALLSLLDLIEYGLLQVDQSKRLEAKNLGRRLQLIYDTAKRRPDSQSQPNLQEASEAQVMELEE